MDSANDNNNQNNLLALQPAGPPLGGPAQRHHQNQPPAALLDQLEIQAVPIKPENAYAIQRFLDTPIKGAGTIGGSYFFSRPLNFRTFWRLGLEDCLSILKLKSWTIMNIVILYFSLNFGILKPISCFGNKLLILFILLEVIYKLCDTYIRTLRGLFEQPS